MTEKRFTRDDDSIYDNGEFLFDLTILMYHNADEVVGWLNALHKENQQLKQRIEDYNKALKTLQDVYERKDRQLQRAKKDTRKYTDYLMNELNMDCDRIIEEVFR